MRAEPNPAQGSPEVYRRNYEATRRLIEVVLAARGSNYMVETAMFFARPGGAESIFDDTPDGEVATDAWRAAHRDWLLEALALELA